MKDRLYNTGMQLADCLRLLGKHEESAQIERWVLAMVREIEAKPQRGAEQMKKLEAFQHGDGAHWGLSDWYKEGEAELTAALAERVPFDTGWY